MVVGECRQIRPCNLQARIWDRDRGVWRPLAVMHLLDGSPAALRLRLYKFCSLATGLFETVCQILAPTALYLYTY